MLSKIEYVHRKPLINIDFANSHLRIVLSPAGVYWVNNRMIVTFTLRGDHVLETSSPFY